MNISITVSGEEGQARLRALANGGAMLATVRAMNRTMQTVRTAATRALAEDVGITQRDVRKSMELRRARSSDYPNLEATLIVTGRRIPLFAFRARQTRQGVSYRLPGGRTLAPSAFLARMRSGHEGVFRRRGRARLPIDELRGPSLPYVLGKQRIMEALRTLAGTAFPKNLDHEIEFLEQSSRPTE